MHIHESYVNCYRAFTRICENGMSHEKSIHINVTGIEHVHEYHSNRALMYRKVMSKEMKITSDSKECLDINVAL